MTERSHPEVNLAQTLLQVRSVDWARTQVAVPGRSEMLTIAWQRRPTGVDNLQECIVNVTVPVNAAVELKLPTGNATFPTRTVSIFGLSSEESGRVQLDLQGEGNVFFVGSGFHQFITHV